MHLDDALGHQKGLHCIYDHHEQACAIAAEAYARIHNKMAALCVTTGPGGTNAITGVLGAWLDSIPMICFQDRCAMIPQPAGQAQASALWGIRNLISVRPLTV